MIISLSCSQIQYVITILSKASQLNDLGDITKYLGINIQNDCDGIRIHQQDKIYAFCKDIGMIQSEEVSTHISDDNLIDRETENLCSKSDSILYHSVVGSLLHISSMTRPDI